MKKLLLLVILMISILPLQSFAALDDPTISHSTSGLSVSISWTDVPGATGYRFYFAPNPFAGLETISHLNMGMLRGGTISLWDGASFLIAVEAYNDTENSFSNIDQFTLEQSTEINISGEWQITETTGMNNCGDSVGVSWAYPVSVNHMGNIVTIYSPNGLMDGTILGNTVTMFPYSYLEDEGTTTVISHTIEISEDGTYFNGIDSWTWTDGSFSCSGVCTQIGIKQ